MQEVVDLHYNQMINLRPATMNTNSLRTLLDNIERHLRSLEVLNQNINQHVFVSMIRAKLPEEVLLQLEIINGAKNKWTISKLRDKLRECVTAREKAEKKNKPTEQRSYSNNKNSHFRPPEVSKNQPSSITNAVKNSWTRNSTVTGSAEALVANTKQNTVHRHYDQCRYCDKRHWSDECPKYKSIEERKQQLKDSCYRCLKVGHVSKECKQTKMCVYCGEFNVHHRSLCPKKFRSSVSSVHLSEETSDVAKEIPSVQENVLVSLGQIVLMQTAKTEIKHPLGSGREQVRILMDSGSQKTYVTERLAEKLGLTREDEQEIK